MKRIVVGFEGETPAGHYVVPNSISTASLTVPVILNGRQIGYASDLQHGENRSLTMGISLAAEHLFTIDLNKYEARIELYNLDAEKKSNGKLIVRKATIGSVALARI